MRNLFVAAAAATVVALSPVLAADDAQAQFAAAVKSAEAHAAQRFAFTATFAELSAEDPSPVSFRFDPRLPEGERWTAIGDEEALSKAAKRRLRALRGKSDDADGALVHDGLAKAAGDVALLSETAEEASFRIAAAEADTPADVREAVAVVAVLDKKGGYIRAIEMRAERPFKPVKVARVDAFDQTQIYLPLAPSGPALLRSIETKMTGEAMFRSFSEHTRIDYSDFDAVEAAPFAAAK